jgi:hypothetical protein
MTTVYKSEWQGNVEDGTGFANFSCGVNRIKFKMSSFGDYLALCRVIDSACDRVECITKAEVSQRVMLALGGEVNG